MGTWALIRLRKTVLVGTGVGVRLDYGPDLKLSILVIVHLWQSRTNRDKLGKWRLGLDKIVMRLSC